MIVIIQNFEERGKRLVSICKLTYDQIKKLSKEMVILVDTREKNNGHIIDYFNKKGIAYKKQALEFGDYSFMLPKVEGLTGNELYFHKEIVVERKNSLEELSGNLGQNRDRFEKEFLKARNNGCSIHLMVENPQGYNDIMKHNYNTQLKPVSYMASLKSFEERYDLKIQFVESQYSGYIIYSTFYYYMRNKLH